MNKETVKSNPDSLSNEDCLTKSQLAEIFDVSTNTIDSWLRKGCPYIERGRNGKAWQFSLRQVAAWREKMARNSEQKWRGDHVNSRRYEHNPELEELFNKRPDLKNGLRFFTEDSITTFLETWCSTGYAFETLEQFEKITKSKTESARLLQIAATYMFVCAANYILDDTLNKSIIDEGSVDAVWADITGLPVKSRAPDDAENLLMARVMPAWVTSDTEEFANAYWQRKQQNNLPEESRHE